MVVGETAVAVKRDDKIGLTGCDKSGGPVRRGREVKCAAGGGGDGDRIGGERVGRPFGIVVEPYHSNPTTRAWHFLRSCA